MRVIRIVLGAAAIAVAYVLSPLTVWFAVVMILAVTVLTHNFERGERQFVVSLVVLAIVLRVAIVLGLFLATNHHQAAFGSFFGDEEYFIKRSLWLRNLALGHSLHAIDLEYAFEPNGSSSFLYVIAFIQAIVGPAPYGLHLVNIALYVAAVLILYRVVRRSYGRMPAAFGLIVLLFQPTLLIWSTSVLKESAFVLAGAASLALARRFAAVRSWRSRMLCGIALIALAAAVQTLRRDGGVFLAAGTIAGLMLAFVTQRPRLMLATIVSAPILAAAVLRIPEVQLRGYAAVQSVARQHWGAVVVSRGYEYRLLDDRFYPDINIISSLTLSETLRYLVRGAIAFVTVPRPSEASSLAAAAYVPEQVIWYALIVLALAGAGAGFRRDPVLTALLIVNAVLVAAAAALTDGNVGTLVRHRALAVPYVVWLSGVGGCELVKLILHRCSFVPAMPVAATRSV
jgi:Dolichyl-phosphate-mannose-protein mannosyltransferase